MRRMRVGGKICRYFGNICKLKMLHFYGKVICNIQNIPAIHQGTFLSVSIIRILFLVINISLANSVH